MHKKLTVLAVTGVAAAGAATAVAAPSSHSTKSPAARYETNLAGKLGVDQAKLDRAQTSAADETIDQLVAAGKLKSDRAAKLKAAVAKGRVPFAAGKQGRRAAGPRLLAKALGATPKDVATKLRAGTTPADVITAAGKDPATVAAAIRSTVRERLQQRVDAGKVDSAKADARASAVATRLTADTPLKQKAPAAG